MQVKTVANLSQASILKFIAEAIRLIPKIAANCNRQNKAIITIRMYRSIKLVSKRSIFRLGGCGLRLDF